MSEVHVFVLIDALGWELIRERPFLPEFLSHQQPLRTLLGFSSGIIPAMLTGCTPAENGIWNLVYFDPENSPFRGMRAMGPMFGKLLDNRVGRRVLAEIGRRILGMGSTFDICVPPQSLSWFSWAESRNIYQREGIPGQRSIFDLLHEKQIAHKIYTYKDCLSDEEILKRAEGEIAEGCDRIYFVYLSELDMFLHSHRGNPEMIAGKLDWYEKSLGRVFRAAKNRSARAQLCVFSDHGMAAVKHHCDLGAWIDRCGLQCPGDYLAVYDSTMARFWFFSAKARTKIESRLRQLDCARILTDEELRELGVYFDDHRYGELIALLDPGYIVAQSGFNGNGWKPAGMHGYHPDDPDSNAVFLSSEIPHAPMTSVRDVFGRMLEAVE